MAKYDAKFKLKVVKYVLEEKHGVKAAKKAFGLHSHGDVVKWVNKYLEHGEKGLVRNNFKYDSNFKRDVVEYMKEKNLSITQTLIHFNLANAQTISKWIRQYETGELENIKIRNERKKEMAKIKKENKKQENVDTKKLLEENEYLRMENAYLKKLNALVQERIKQESKKK